MTKYQRFIGALVFVAGLFTALVGLQADDTYVVTAGASAVVVGYIIQHWGEKPA